MILPMMGFFFMLMLFGGIGSIAVMVDTYAAKKAPIPLAMFFAGLGVYVLVFVGGFLGSYVSPAFGDTVAFLIAPVVGSVGGGILGYRLGLRRRQHGAKEGI